MQTIKQFTVGDRIPDEAKMLGMQVITDFKKQERRVEFYMAVPDKKSSAKR